MHKNRKRQISLSMENKKKTTFFFFAMGEILLHTKYWRPASPM